MSSELKILKNASNQILPIHIYDFSNKLYVYNKTPIDTSYPNGIAILMEGKKNYHY